MARWRRDLVIAALGLAGGYVLFSPKAAVTPQPAAYRALNVEGLIPLESEPAAARKEPEKRTAKIALSEAAIAAAIVEGSRQSYYATGRPCACPEDRTASGRKCGGNSAYSRAGGAHVFCYPSDVPASLIEKRRAAGL
jgi:hypothetical protein